MAKLSPQQSDWRGFKSALEQHRDRHDPDDVHLQRACQASLAGLLAAGFLYFLPAIAHPLIVIAALIFAHTNKGSNPRQQQLSMLRAVLVTIGGIALLAPLQNLPLLQSALIVLLSFLSQYVVRFGSRFESSLIWILILVAIAESPPLSEIPKILLNIGLGFGLAFLCCFILFPYNPQAACDRLVRHTHYYLAKLLQLTVQSVASSLNGMRSQRHSPAELKETIFNLIQVQQGLLQQNRSTRLRRKLPLGGYQPQLINQQQQVFEAILVLEQTLMSLPVEERLDTSLGTLLKQLSDNGTARLTTTAALEPIQSIEQQIEDLLLSSPLQPAQRLHLLALQNLSATLTSFTTPVQPDPLLNHPPLEYQVSSLPAWNWGWSLGDPVTRRAIRTAIAVTVAIAIGQAFQLPHAHWITVSALIVSRDSIGNTLWKAQGRLVGTALGVVAALGFYGLAFNHPKLIFVTAFLTIFPYLYLRPSLANYSYAKFFQQIAFVCFLSTLGAHPTTELLEWRAINIAIGCGIAIMAALLILPNRSRPQWKQGLLKAWGDCANFFRAIVNEYQSLDFDHHRIQELNRQTQQSVFMLGQHLEGRKHESLMSTVSLAERLALIQANQQIYETLLYLSYITPQIKLPDQPGTLSRDTQSLIQKITAVFEMMPNFIGTRFSAPLPLLDCFANPQQPERSTLDEQDRNWIEQSFLLLLNQLCDAMNHYGEVRHRYTMPQINGESPTNR